MSLLGVIFKITKYNPTYSRCMCINKFVPLHFSYVISLASFTPIPLSNGLHKHGGVYVCLS